ncbi:MAG: copper-binding protein [Pseudomonadota bacterium]
MKQLKKFLLMATLVASTSHAQTSVKPVDPPAAMDRRDATTAPEPEMTEAEVRKVDMETKKVTLKHGAIKNLDMPAMTMVFQVREPAMLANIKAGDKVRFHAEKSNGAIVVTDLQPSR